MEGGLLVTRELPLRPLCCLPAMLAGRHNIFGKPGDGKSVLSLDRMFFLNWNVRAQNYISVVLNNGDES